MTLKECTALLTPLALALRADLDDPTFRAYHRVLKDVPVLLGQAAVAALEDTGLRFFPTATEITFAAEKARRQVLALHPYDGCADCEDQRGYRTVVLKSGQKTVERCPCKARHTERLEAMGVLEPIALLPNEVGVGDQVVYPTLDQLPEPLQQRLKAVTAQKVIRS